MDNDQTPELTDQELQDQTGEELPDREAMSLINANIAIPVNAAVAANVLSGVITRTCGSTTRPEARRTFLVDQNEIRWR